MGVKNFPPPLSDRALILAILKEGRLELGQWEEEVKEINSEARNRMVCVSC